MKINSNWNLLWNPFTRVAGWQAFGIGIIIVLISAIIASFGNLAFDGAVDAHFGENITFAQSLAVTGLSLLSVVLSMWVVALIISKSFRFIDILGTMTLARAPFLILALLSPLASFPTTEQMFENPMVIFDYPSVLIIGLIAVPIVIWSVALMFNGLKVSTGTKGSKLIIGFIVGILVAEIISKVLIYLIM